MSNLTIIEPNLRNPSGHYAEFIHAISQPATDLEVDLTVCAHPDANNLLNAMKSVSAHGTTPRTNQTWGEWKIIAQKVESKEPTLILTSNAKHVTCVNYFSKIHGIKPKHMCFYFHWIEHSKSKKLMHRFSKRTREYALAIAPTPGIAASLKELGWKRVNEIPYPAATPEHKPQKHNFQKLLMAGAARINKGLPLIADLAERWAKQDKTIPLYVQISTKHANKHGTRERAVVERLISSGYKGLRCDEIPPPRKQYFKRFEGALVLAPYEQKKFKNGVSGVVLDALLSGAPVIATKGTWAGDQIDRFGAGLNFQENSVEELETAIQEIIENWDAYQARAVTAAQTLAKEHYPHNLLKSILESSQT